MNALLLNTAETNAFDAAEMRECGRVPWTTGDSAEASEALAELLDSVEPLEPEAARQIMEILSRIPGSRLRDLTEDSEVFRQEWNQLKPRVSGMPDTLPLEESVYKAWTADKAHPLAGRTGLAWGDPALHMLAALEHSGLSLESHADRAPDNLVVLLDFMSFLIRNRPQEEVAAFCKDHLDWLPQLGKEAEARQLGRLFLTVVEAAECLIGHVASLRVDGDL